MKVDAAIRDIIRINEHIRDFWGDGGWAPARSASLLSNARLDRQVSLSRTLRNWTAKYNDDEIEGQLILAWVNLGSLVEGTMKWFLCVFAHDYDQNPVVCSERTLEPDELFFGRMCDFFKKTVWTKIESNRWSDWVNMVRRRRNAIHAYRDSNIGTFGDFHDAVIKYRAFLLNCEGTAPYPDENYAYPADIYEMQLEIENSEDV
jgi:hypothetical protein